MSYCHNHRSPADRGGCEEKETTSRRGELDLLVASGLWILSSFRSLCLGERNLLYMAGLAFPTVECALHAAHPPQEWNALVQNNSACCDSRAKHSVCSNCKTPRPSYCSVKIAKHSNSVLLQNITQATQLFLPTFPPAKRGKKSTRQNFRQH